jgi:hypothetical protein
MRTVEYALLPDIGPSILSAKTRGNRDIKLAIDELDQTEAERETATRIRDINKGKPGVAVFKVGDAPMVLEGLSRSINRFRSDPIVFQRAGELLAMRNIELFDGIVEAVLTAEHPEL